MFWHRGYVCVCARVHECVRLCVCRHVHVCMCVDEYVCACAGTCMCVCVFVCPRKEQHTGEKQSVQENAKRMQPRALSLKHEIEQEKRTECKRKIDREIDEEAA